MGVKPFVWLVWGVVVNKSLLMLSIVIALIGGYVFGTLQNHHAIELPPSDWAEGIEAAQAWREFSASLEAGGALVVESAPDVQARHDGLAFIAELASASLEMKLTRGSTTQPQFTDWMSGYRKFLGDSPDALYHSAEVSSENQYVISGHRGDADYVGLTLYGRHINGWNRVSAHLTHDDIEFDTQGNFSVSVSVIRPEGARGNWLAMDKDAHLIMVRQYFHDRDQATKATLQIENLSAKPKEATEPVSLSGDLRRAAEFFNSTLQGTVTLARMMSHMPNSIEPPRDYSPDFGGVFYPTPDNEYLGGWYKLEKDEALIVEGAVPNAAYWSVSLQNRWLQSLDYEKHQTALNHRQIQTEDGQYTVIISSQKPPSGNWLDTAGRDEGLLAIRYQRVIESESPTVRLVKLANFKH